MTCLPSSLNRGVAIILAASGSACIGGLAAYSLLGFPNTVAFTGAGIMGAGYLTAALMLLWGR